MPLEPRQIFIVDCFSTDDTKDIVNSFSRQSGKTGQQLFYHFQVLLKYWEKGWSIILPAVMVGEGLVVAAGAVATKDVEPWSVVAGNPAQFIKKRELKDDG